MGCCALVFSFVCSGRGCGFCIVSPVLLLFLAGAPGGFVCCDLFPVLALLVCVVFQAGFYLLFCVLPCAIYPLCVCIV